MAARRQANKIGSCIYSFVFYPRSDLSPDGIKLIYFATNYSQRNDFPIAWTGVSKAPWLTTLGLWPQGDTYFGGGLFETNERVWVNVGRPDAWLNGQKPGQFHPPGLEVDYEHPSGLEVDYEHPFYDHDWHQLCRMERNGWQVVEPYPSGSVPIAMGLMSSSQVTQNVPCCRICALFTKSHNSRAISHWS